MTSNSLPLLLSVPRVSSAFGQPLVVVPLAHRRRGCRFLGVALVAVSCLAAGGCSNRPSATSPPILDRLPEKLSELGLFDGELRQLRPAPEVHAYQVNSPAFNDHAVVGRWIRLPTGRQAAYQPEQPFDFPPGTLVAQTLGYRADRRDSSSAQRIVETRVLWRKADAWDGVSYAWKPDQSEAVRATGGKTLAVSWIEPDGNPRDYAHTVPNVNDCRRCHKIGGAVTPLGLTARQLNVVRSSTGSQLANWVQAGLLSNAPSEGHWPRLADWADPQSGALADRARAYLEANCAHCHNPDGAARNSSLFLSARVDQPALFGIYKTPVAAGRGSGGLRFDIVPGKPDQSILVHRIRSTEPGVLMPEFGRKLVDEAGVELVSRWIASLSVESGVPAGDLVGEFAELSQGQIEQWVTEAERFGDVDRGEEILHRSEVTCLKCHAVDGAGASVGPDLARLPAEVTPAHLVESLLVPARVLRQGYATVTVATSDGQVLSGVRVREDAQELVLNDPVRGVFSVPLDEIEQRTEGGSLMPSNVASLFTKAEFRDLLKLLFQLHQASDSSTPASQHVRRYEVLQTSSALLDHLSPEEIVADLARNTQLVWGPAFSRRQGLLPLSAVPESPGGRRAAVRVPIASDQVRPERLAFDSLAGLVVASGGQVLPLGADNTVSIPAGSQELTILIDLQRRSPRQLRCEWRTGGGGQ